jgi:Flp pilus assembly protein TadG
MEFTLAFLPFLAMTFLLMDVAWAVFVKATLQYAVRAGVRTGITITGTQATAAHSDLTSMVKSVVQQSSLGILSGSTGLSKIKVRYFQPPPEGSTSGITDVSAQTNGNSYPNIMQVSIEGFSLPALVPRFYNWKTAADKSPTTIGVVAADIIEPSGDVPPIGVAP